VAAEPRESGTQEAPRSEGCRSTEYEFEAVIMSVSAVDDKGRLMDALEIGEAGPSKLLALTKCRDLPHLESGTFSGQTVAEQILWSGASGRIPDIVRMPLEWID
jgi:hypothetical protein